MPSPETREEILATRRAVWEAWYSGDVATLEALLPEDFVGINAGEEAWLGRAEAVESSRRFAAGSGRLLAVNFSDTAVRVYGNVAIVFSRYACEYLFDGEPGVLAGRATEVFVRSEGRWTHPGWHLDSGS